MVRKKLILATLPAAVALMALGSSTAHAAPAKPSSVSGRCSNAHVCVFADSDFGGTGNSMAVPGEGLCATYTGFSTANRVSSIDFPGSDSTHQAWFYDGNDFVISVRENHYLRNLASDTSASGGNANDKIDKVVVCNS